MRYNDIWRKWLIKTNVARVEGENHAARLVSTAIWGKDAPVSKRKSWLSQSTRMEEDAKEYKLYYNIMHCSTTVKPRELMEIW
jgi:hypothetical protein